MQINREDREIDMNIQQQLHKALGAGRAIYLYTDAELKAGRALVRRGVAVLDGNALRTPPPPVRFCDDHKPEILQ